MADLNICDHCGDCDGDHDNPACPAYEATRRQARAAASCIEDARLVADLKTMRDAAVANAHRTSGSGLELAVSGNGESWSVWLNGEAFTERSSARQFGDALNEAATKARRLGYAR